jgi:hypothetical protein
MQPTIMTNVFYHNKGEGVYIFVNKVSFIFSLGQPSWACSLSRTIILSNECNLFAIAFLGCKCELCGWDSWNIYHWGDLQTIVFYFSINCDFHVLTMVITTKWLQDGQIALSHHLYHVQRYKKNLKLFPFLLHFVEDMDIFGSLDTIHII